MRLLSPGVHLRDGARISLQSAAGAALAWLVVSPVLPAHASWAVFSAIYVVSRSTGDTLRVAAGRSIGTVLGTIIGVISVALLSGQDNTVLRIPLAAFAAGLLTTFRPNWSFAVMVAVVVALHQDGPALSSALERGFAILLGAAAGTAAAFLLWRESAQHRTGHALKGALDGCRQLLEAGIDSAASSTNDLQPLHRDVAKCLQRARDEAAGSSSKWRPALRQRIDVVQRLWHALLIIDRATHQDWPVEHLDREDRASALYEVRDAAVERLTAINTFGSGSAGGDRDRLHNAVRQAVLFSAPAPDQTGERGWEDIMLGGLVFALAEVERNIIELEDLLHTANGK